MFGQPLDTPAHTRLLNEFGFHKEWHRGANEHAKHLINSHLVLLGFQPGGPVCSEVRSLHCVSRFSLKRRGFMNRSNSKLLRIEDSSHAHECCVTGRVGGVGVEAGRSLARSFCVSSLWDISPYL